MISRYVAYALCLILISSIAMTVPVFGAGLEDHNIPPLSVTTDADSYNQGDTIVITGKVKTLEEGVQITLRILDPNSNLIQIGQFAPSEDGTFSKTYKATGPLWKPVGNYTVVVQYGSAQQADAEFAFSGGDGSTTIIPAIEETFTIDMNEHGTYDIDYIIKGGTVEDMKVDPDGLALIITINAQKDGSISVTLPRDLMDAKKPANLSPDDILAGVTIDPEDLEDDEFFVLIDGDDSNFKETKNSKTSRTLSISFSSGDSEIEIVGTQIIPEFGAVAALILAVAIISIIAVSAKTRLRLMPKY